jgi:hypothetical protein
LRFGDWSLRAKLGALLVLAALLPLALSAWRGIEQLRARSISWSLLNEAVPQRRGAT